VSAVEEYKRHRTSTTTPWATDLVMRSVADAAIAELEAKLTAIKEASNVTVHKEYPFTCPKCGLEAILTFDMSPLEKE
jgi:hypothetical protein